MFLMALTPAIWAEQRGNPQFAALGLHQHATAGQSGGNMEGKETRFGTIDSALWATVTTDTSCGAVNSMHDSFTPLGGLVPLVDIQIGEIIFGGVGSGLYGMLVMAVLSVFIAGLMVGRTPEYLGKKIEAREMKLAMLFSQILDAYSEVWVNNGSAFGCMNSNIFFYYTTLAFVMLFGRFMMKIPVLALAGSLAGKKVAPPSAGTFPTNGAIFVVLLIGVILIVAALTFFPADALGPIVEHLAMMQGKLY
jgi:K+-transporting ATPase ATPase A chain